MINALHLIWIIPLCMSVSACIGIAIMAFMKISREQDMILENEPFEANSNIKD